MARVVIIPCSKRKASTPRAAETFYQGQYFKAALAAARRLTPEGCIYILSGKYGFIGLDAILAPYEQRIDEPGGVTVEAAAAQAGRLGILRADPIVLCPSSYAAFCRSIWPAATFPLKGVGGIGRQKALLKRLDVHDIQTI